MKIAWFLIISTMMISCGAHKPQAEKKTDNATAGDAKKATEKVEIIPCEAYEQLNIGQFESVHIFKDDIDYKTEVRPAITSEKFGTCHIVDAEWVELDTKAYIENMPTPESPEYQKMKDACAALQENDDIAEYAIQIEEEVKTLEDSQIKGILIATKELESDEDDITQEVYKCSTDFGVFQPVQITKTKETK